MTLQPCIQDDEIVRSISDQVRAQIEHLPLTRRTVVSLKISSNLTETAAYELARTNSAQSTASLILAAAELDRLADRQRRRAA